MIAKYSMLLLLAAAPAAAQTTPSAAKPVADPNKKLCRRVETTGSIMPGKSTCHTRAEWAQIDEANAKATAAFSAQRSTSGLGSN